MHLIYAFALLASATILYHAIQYVINAEEIADT